MFQCPKLCFRSKLSYILIQSYDKDREIPWFLPIGIVCDMFFPNQSTGYYALIARFNDHSRTQYFQCQSTALFNSAVINQLKAALCVRSQGLLGTLNRLSKIELLELLEIACGPRPQKSFEPLDGLLLKDSFLRLPVHIHYCGLNFIETVSCSFESDRTISDIFNMFADDSVGSIRLIVHGISPPLNLSLGWLAKAAPYSDGWLHISLVRI